MKRVATHKILGMAAACFFALLCAPFPTRAEEPDMAQANQLLRDGQALWQQGKQEEGCRKIEESVRVRAGYAAELALADCHAALGRPARAAQELSSIARRAALRSKVDTANLSIYQAYITRAEQRLRVLAPKLAGLPTITLVLSPEILATAGVIARLDGIAVEPLQARVSIAVDPGHHVVRLLAPGKKERTFETDITQSERIAPFDALEDDAPPPAPAPEKPAATPALSVSPSAPPPATASLLATATSPDPGPKPSAEPKTGLTARDLGIASGLTLAVAGLSVGIGFAVAAGDKRDEGLRQGCGAADEPTACQGLRADYDKLVAGEVTGFVGAGIGLVLAGALYWTRPPRGPQVSFWLLPATARGASLGVTGRF